MSQYPTVYNQNTGDDDKDGLGINLDMDEEDDDPMSPGHDQLEVDKRSQREIEAVKN